jgi:hypothetical protein
MSNPLENALQRSTFNVLDAVRGRGYPTDTVTVFAAEDAAYEAAKIQAELADEKDAKKVKALEKRLGELINEVKESALEFHLRGISPRVVEDIRKANVAKYGPGPNGEPPLEEGDVDEANGLAWTALSIEKIVDAHGNEHTEKLTPEQLRELFDNLPVIEAARVIDLAQQLIFGAVVFDEVVGPDFSRRR